MATICTAALMLQSCASQNPVCHLFQGESPESVRLTHYTAIAIGHSPFRFIHHIILKK